MKRCGMLRKFLTFIFEFKFETFFKKIFKESQKNFKSQKFLTLKGSNPKITKVK
jgi:hypothetical protein